MKRLWMILITIGMLLATLPALADLVGVQTNAEVYPGHIAYYSAFGVGTRLTTGGGFSDFSTEVGTQTAVAFGATASHLTVHLTNTVAAGGTVTITFRVNGFDTLLSISLGSLTPPGVYQDSVHTVALVAGDLISYKVTNASSTKTRLFGFSFEYAP